MVCCEFLCLGDVQAPAPEDIVLEDPPLRPPVFKQGGLIFGDGSIPLLYIYNISSFCGGDEHPFTNDFGIHQGTNKKTIWVCLKMRCP